MPVETGSRVLGREDLVAEVVSLLAAPGGVVTLVGEPGIGKTTVFQQAFAACGAGWRWSCQCLEAEAELGLAVLADLFGAVPEAELAALPARQREALDVVLYRDTGGADAPLDERLLGATTLSLLHSAASRGPVLLGIDDLQWCDPTSFTALQYAVHRLGDDAVAVLTACRAGVRRRFVRSRRVDVPPLGSDVVAEVVGDVLGVHADQVAVHEIAAASGGNPFFARELARASAAGLSTHDLPSSVRQVLTGRLATVGSASRVTLLDVAVRGAPDRRLLHANLDDVLEAELLTVVEGRVMFTHPLLATAVVEDAAPEELVAAHRRAAEVATDPVARALHRARSSEAGDDVAAELDDAAAIALRRGDPAGARVLAQLAVELTPGQQAPVSRLLRLAGLETAFDADERAAELGRQVLQLNPAPHERARALMEIAYVHYFKDPRTAIDLFRQAADIDGLPEADAQDLRAGIADLLYESGHPEQAIAELTGFLDQLPEITTEHADLVAELSFIRRLSGLPDDQALLHRLIDSSQVQDPLYGTYATATGAVEIAAIIATLADRHDEARGLLAMAEQSAARAGEKDTAGYFNGLLACRTGDLTDAERQLQLTLSLDDWNPLGWARLALVYAWMGDEPRALEQVHQARMRLRLGWHRQEAEVSFAAAFVDLLAGRFGEAWPVLRDTAEMLNAVGYREPSHPPVLPAAVEAAAAVGDLDAAEKLCARLERDTAAVDSRFGAAAARRGRGHIAQARAERDAAEACFAEAAAGFTAAGLRLEAARSLLALGGLLRRTGHRRRARQALETARIVFAEAGANGLSLDTDAELARISGRSAGAPNDLTESERQVADLVARGLRNADVARTLHLSVKTVETHLGRIYRKLELANRNELIAVMNRPTRR